MRTLVARVVSTVAVAAVFFLGGTIMANDLGSFPLRAGQNVFVGEVIVHNNNGTLELTFTITEDDFWCLQEIHAHVASSPDEVPQTKRRNPIPGQFLVREELDCQSSITVNLGPVPNGDFVIAAHGEVDNTPSCGLEGSLCSPDQFETVWGGESEFSGTNWATYVLVPGDVGVDCPDNLVPGADLHNCNLSGADLSSANLSNADLSNADLSSAKLVDADLHGADLNDADLGGADMTGADLSDADLSFANLTGGILFTANLHESDLSFANLSHADLRIADLGDANLSFADLREADLSNADLGYANLSNALLDFANLTDADLEGANLQDARLTFADLEGANLYFADLNGAGLQDVVWSNTTCPDRTNSNDSDGDGFTCLNNLVFP